MIKKICCLLSAAVIVGTFTTVTAEVSEQTETNLYEAEILTDLGIIDETVYSENTISRIKFLKSICVAISGSVPSGNDIFEMGKEYNITAATSVSEFRGNDAITYDEALKMAVSACGYDAAAKMCGGYPKGYREIASRLDIGVKGVDSNGAIKVYDAIEILFEMIKAPALTLYGVEGNAGIYEESKETLLQKRDISWIEGVVSGNANTLLNNPSGGGESTVFIDEIRYKSNLDKAQDYLGYRVTACVDKEDNIIAIAKMANKNKEYTILGEDIRRSENELSVIYYLDENEKEKKLKISPIVDVIHNGYALLNYSEADFKPNIGESVFIDNTGDGVIDVIKITEKQLIVVDYVSVKSKIIYNKLNDVNLPTLDLGGINVTYEFYCGDEAVKMGDLQQYDILEVMVPRYKAPDYKVHGTVTRNSLTGKLLKIDSEDGYMTIGEAEQETELKYNGEFARLNLDKKLDNGSEVTVYLDSMGYAAYVKTISGEQYVFATKVRDMDSVYELRYIGEDGEWHDTPMADKVRYNLLASQPAESVYNLLGGNTFKRKLLRINTNKDGKITDILEQGIDRTEETRFVLSKQVNEMWTTNNNSFLWKGYLSDDAVVFLVPESDSASRDEYMCGGRGVLISGNNYTAELYNIDDFDTSDLAVVYSSANAVPEGNDWFIVTKKIVSLNEDDEPVIRLISEFGNDETNTVVEGKENVFKDIDVGDFLIFSLDNKGRANAKKVIHDLSSGPVASNNNGVFHNNQIVLKGTLEKTDPINGMLRVNYNGSVTAIPVPSTAQILFYDVRENEIKYVTSSDLITDDYVLAVYDYGNFKKMAVIRY